MNRETLDSAKKGSDLHGLIDHTAYLISLDVDLKLNTKDENWNRAKDAIIFSGYASSKGKSNQIYNLEAYTKTLNWTSERIDHDSGRSLGCFNSWIKAQMQWASNVVRGYKFYYRSLPIH